MGNIKPTNLNVLNAMRNSGLLPADRLPEVTLENIASVYEQILNVEVIRSAFASALIEQMVQGRINSAYFRNPLGMLKSNPMRYGATEQEIFVNMAKAQVFDGFADASVLYKYYEGEVLAAYHHMSPALQYPITVTYDNMRNAFQTEYGIMDLIRAKVESTVSGAEWDEYLSMKQLIVSAYNSSQLFPVQVEEPTDEASARALTIAMKTWIGKMKFPNKNLNIAGADSNALLDGIYYMVTPEVDAVLDVDVLAYAFNMNKADIEAHKIVIDSFGNSDIKVALFDMRWYRVREQYRVMSDSKNGAALTWTYFYNIKNMYSYSPFFPCIAFTTKTVSMKQIDVTPIADAKKGSEYKITALAAPTSVGDYVLQTFDYEVSGNTSTHTAFVPGSNVLMIANDEKAETLTVTVKAHWNNSITGTGTVAITG